MTTAAISVFPSPVGNATNVFENNAVLVMASWYSRSGTFTAVAKATDSYTYNMNVGYRKN